MKVVMTGASGFVGRQLAHTLVQETDCDLVLLDAHFSAEELAQNDPRIKRVVGRLQDKSVRDSALENGVDVLYHLAAVPGGAAENDPELSRAVNLDASLALLEEAAEKSPGLRVVYTSTIAVLGAPMPSQVDDLSPIVPAMTYGAHKAMLELALADMSRRGLVDAVSVRLPGIVARPAAASGMKSAFLSNVFHALKAGEAFVSPVSKQATFWMMSVAQCADNLAAAATLDSARMPASRAVTLPVVRCTMQELVSEIASQSGFKEDLVSYQPEADLEEHFGTQPPIKTEAAEFAGFTNDGSLAALVRRALSLC